MCQKHHVRLGMSLQDLGQVVRVHRLSPLELEPHDVGPVCGGQRSEALAEVPAQGGDHLVARRDQVGDGRLQAPGA